MQKNYRIVFESYDPASTSETVPFQTVLMSGIIKEPVDLFSVGFTHEEQIKIIKSSQDVLLKEQFDIADSESCCCPRCIDGKLVKSGKNKSNYHDIFTDHVLLIPRKRCLNCKYAAASTIKTLFGSALSAELVKLQSELGSDYSYRESEQIFSRFSHGKREVNNHDRVKQTSEIVGEEIKSLHHHDIELTRIEPALELIVNVDGGHIKTTEAGKRSFEAMAAIIYKPESLVSNESGTRNHIISKHCAVSTQDDNQQQMIANTIIAALKQGLCPHTKVTALCDGASNCWQIVQALVPIAASVLCILDWFHLSMKIQNISLTDDLKPQLESIKWYLWHGKVQDGLTKLAELIWNCPQKQKLALEKLKTYIENNSDKIVNYDERKNNGLVFTSNLAESTVESLINQRCKGQKKMRWSREGLDPILQLRAAINSDEWDKNWKTIVMNSITKH